jgi:hypothetical protein
MLLAGDEAFAARLDDSQNGRDGEVHVVVQCESELQTEVVGRSSRVER